MKTTRMITADMLREQLACTGQYNLFCRTWPDGCKVTLKDCKNAVRLGFDIDWAAQHLLGKAELKAYYEAVALAQKEYDEAIAPARKAYHEAVAPAVKAYREAIAPARKVYDEAVAPAWKAYDEAVAPELKAYHEMVAIAFYEAWHRA